MPVQIVESETAILSIGEMSGLIGLDDSTGASGDRMNNESTNEATNRP